ncbi:hypothetical protein Cgig2_024291 [Carnegiea gigantea]|uniref:Uncharacterized protein n=1 Tax=Carnegiea gigantea TaxID=171969 RepID=A0A9Q1GRM2_9CARY|nr:hypothetical protein Cgig2_024291 [Carnegiea gigantea]
MPEFSLAKKDRGKSSKRNFVIYLMNCYFNGPKNNYCSKSILKYVKDVNQIASLDWSNVRQYKESKSAKRVHFDSLLFFLVRADEKTETKNKDNGDKSLDSIPQNEHLSQEPSQKPKKKKKTDKKGKIESKSNKELTAKKQAYDQQMEKDQEKEGLPNKPVDKVAKKRKIA